MVPEAVRAGRPVVVLNAEPTEMDDLAAVVLRGQIADLLPRILGVQGDGG
jgi:NAD-dependent SIR2 family protein deacetylase